MILHSDIRLSEISTLAWYFYCIGYSVFVFESKLEVGGTRFQRKQAQTPHNNGLNLQASVNSNSSIVGSVKDLP